MMDKEMTQRPKLSDCAGRRKREFANAFPLPSDQTLKGTFAADDGIGYAGIMSARVMACTFLLFGIWLGIEAGLQEYRGVAVYRTRYDINNTVYKKSENPRMFRNVLIWEWSTAGGWFTVGVLSWLGIRRQDSLDILSPSFKGQALADDSAQWQARRS